MRIFNTPSEGSFIYPIVFGNHHADRMKKDCMRNMLEAMIDGDYDTASQYANMNKEFGDVYSKFFNSSDCETLVRERVKNPGFTIDEELEKDIRRLLELYRKFTP